MPIHAHFVRRAILTCKISQTDLVFDVCDQGSLVGLCMSDYKSSCVVVMICAAVVNTQMHTHTDTLTDRQQFDQLI